MGEAARARSASAGGFLRDVAWTLGGSAGSLVFGLVAGAVTARLLGPEGRGTLALLVSLAGIVSLFFGFGLANSLIYFVSSGRHPLRDLLRLHWKLVFATTGLGLAAFWSLAGAFGGAVVGTATPAAVLVAGWLVFETLFVKQTSAVLRGLRRMPEIAVAGVLRQVIRVVLTVVLVAGLGLGVTGAVVAIIAGGLIAVAAPLRSLLVPDVVAAPGGGGEPVRIGAVLRFGALDWVLGFLWFANLRVDAFLIQHFLDSAAVGHYSQAAGLAEQLWLISSAISAALLPNIVARSPSERALFTARTCRTTALVLALVAAPGILLAGPVILTLYGREFLPSVLPFQVLVGAAMALALRSLLAEYFRAQDAQRVSIACTAVASVFNVLGNLWAIPRYGIVGSAVVSMLSYGLDLALALAAFQVSSGLRAHRALVPTREEIASLRHLGAAVGRRLRPATRSG
ncbi:flippase [Myxococcota bacterium]|nr:flippase [Myxococcota bacterium]